jgi:hypothetical protein
LVEQCGGLLKAVGVDAPGRQFDRQRYAVKLSADIRDNGCFQIADAEMGAACDRAFHEQSCCRELLNSRRSQSCTLRRIRKRVEPVHMLSLDPKCLAAGCEDVNLQRDLDDACRQCGDRLDKMLAGVERRALDR